MKTLHIDTGAAMRGGQWQALRLVHGLAQAGHGALLLAPAGSDLLHAAEAEHLTAAPLTFRNLFRFARGSQLVHAHDARAHTLALPVPRPLVVSRRVGFRVRRGVLSRWKYARAAHFIAVSEYVARRLREAGIDESRITVVYDGVPLPPEPEPHRDGYVLASDSSDPGKHRALVEEASRLGGFPVRFSGNLPRDLPHAAVFLYISEMEGLGSAALLAMAEGVPVVASRTGGLTEAVQDNATGLLTGNTAVGIASAVQRLLADPVLARGLGRAGAERVKRHFTVQRMVEETVRVYERVLC